MNRRNFFLNLVGATAAVSLLETPTELDDRSIGDYISELGGEEFETVVSFGSYPIHVSLHTEDGKHVGNMARTECGDWSFALPDGHEPIVIDKVTLIFHDAPDLDIHL